MTMSQFNYIYRRDRVFQKMLPLPMRVIKLQISALSIFLENWVGVYASRSPTRCNLRQYLVRKSNTSPV